MFFRFKKETIMWAVHSKCPWILRIVWWREKKALYHVLTSALSSQMIWYAPVIHLLPKTSALLQKYKLDLYVSVPWKNNISFLTPEVLQRTHRQVIYDS